MMGSPASEEGRGDDETQHRVTLTRSFYMKATEVTQAEWRAVMADTPSEYKGDNLPVEGVNWYDALEYCNTLSRKEGLTPCYSGKGDTIQCNWNANGYRLPTEAEWEYAARGGNQSCGYLYAGSNSANRAGWYSGNGGNEAFLPVAQKQANELGLYDMSGNVWEWCWDWYGAYGSGNKTDPAGVSSGSERVKRGGSWYDDSTYCRSAARSGYFPSSYRTYFGFRVARNVE